jgi:hypothetical protein
LAAEVLASELGEGSPDDSAEWFGAGDEDLGLHLWLRKAP